MFALTEVMDELQLIVALPGIESSSNGCFIPLESLTPALLSEAKADALFVAGLSDNQRDELSEICTANGIECVVFESPSKDLSVVQDAVLNLADKLFSDEMPNNIGFADIRNINLDSDYLYAFNSKEAALSFMAAFETGDVVGGVYLAHGDTELSDYEKVCSELLNHFSEEGFLCSSFYTAGRADCTILLGIQNVK